MLNAPRFEILPDVPFERRSSRRIPVSLPVDIEIGDTRCTGRMTELSRAGARMELRGRWTAGEALKISRNGIQLEAQIVWSDGSAAGLLFTEPMIESSFLQLREKPSTT